MDFRSRHSELSEESSIGPTPLHNLLPESRFSRSQQRVLPRIPPQKMIRLRVRRVMLARLPDFMQQKRARPLN
jgi:hypothetical protein